MERFFKQRLPAILAFALAANAASAGAPIVVWCNACSDEQKQAEAVESNAGPLVYVADIVTRSAIAFDVDSSQRTPNDWRIAGAPAHVSLTPGQTEAIRVLIDFYQAVPQGWRKLSVLRYAQASVNAYDVAHDGVEQRLLIDWVSRQPDVVPIDLLQRLARSTPALSLYRKETAPSLGYRVDFPDGSQIHVSFALDAGKPAFIVDPAPGQDSRRNPVLIEASKSPMEFDFDGRGNPGDYADWRSHMVELGYSIADDGPGGQWICANPGAGLRCMHRRLP
ncbi:MAG TPA: hypothetical protein VGC55_07850 [Dokdonella sp.]